MAKEKKRPNTAPDAAPAEPGKKKGLLRRLATLAVIAVLVLTAAAVVGLAESGAFAALRRWLTYGDGGEKQHLYSYSADQNNLYGQLGEELLVVGPNTIRLLQDNGVVIYEKTVGLASPKLTVGATLAAVCDIGGESLCVLNAAGQVWEADLDRGQVYYSARMNSADYLAVTAQKSGYKATVAVYDREGQLIFHFDSHESYISDALVTADGKKLVAVALDTLDGGFASKLLVYDLATAQRLGEIPIRDGLVLDLDLNGDRVLTLCDRRLTISTLEGETLLDRGYDNLYLHDYALTGGDFCALLLGRYRAGNICQLMTYDLAGQELARLDLTEEVLDLSAAGDHLAVLYSDTLVIYDRQLKETARLEGTDYAGQVRQSADGTALVIGGTSAWHYDP